jgi:hypothetical protein
MDYLCRCVAGLVERDEHAWDDFAQTPALSVGEDGRVESGHSRTLVVMVKRIRVDGNVEKRVGWRFVVFDGASSSAFRVNTEVDLAAFS